MITRYSWAPLFATIVLVSGCAQFSTSDKELESLNSTAETKADDYVECLKREASNFSGSTDASFLGDAARSRCQAQMDAYTEAQSAYLDSQYMVIATQLAESVTALEARGRTEIAEMLLSQPASSAAAVAAAVAVARPAEPTAAQSTYLDCMQGQAEKYAGLSESAATIADVAANRCRKHLTTESSPGLEREGRSQAMGTVMDLRVQAAD